MYTQDEWSHYLIPPQNKKLSYFIDNFFDDAQYIYEQQALDISGILSVNLVLLENYLMLTTVNPPTSEFVTFFRLAY